MSVPIPAPAAKRPTAAELLDEIQGRGGRLYRAGEKVFCLTTSAELAGWLVRQGAVEAQHAAGGYKRDRNLVEYDLYVHPIPVGGELELAELL